MHVSPGGAAPVNRMSLIKPAIRSYCAGKSEKKNAVGKIDEESERGTKAARNGNDTVRKLSKLRVRV